MQEALFWEPLTAGRVLCNLCALYCQIAPGRRGACGVRVNLDETLYTLVYGAVVARHIDPIEKKPLFHFRPGSRSYSIATVGCNFRCRHCQNFEISQQPKGQPPPLPESGGVDPQVLCLSLRDLEARIPGDRVAPEEIVQAAQRSGCQSISYTYTEPTIFFEFAYDTARLAAAEDVANVFVTNGYITEEALAAIAPYLDAANIDLKNFNDAAHKRMTGARLQPVLDAIRAYRRLGVWIEVTTLVIAGYNDSPEELRDIAEFIAGVSPDIPWHVTQFYPTYQLLDRERTPLATLRRARDIGYEAGLRYVYEGNVPGEGGEDTYCHGCRSRLIHRYGFEILSNRIQAGCCPDCGLAIPGVAM
ncbi:MAG: AmmeMemoRadiSam system radical SAM enzyme [Deltaproteobacteria bacterium]|nr:AmmeMemoRadiSam system radical SAM enzyme [Deltaproteobacteria bacterium]